MITGGNSTTSTNYTPACCIHKQCNLCPIDQSNSSNRSTLWPPLFCLPPCSPDCSKRAERGKPSKSFCTPHIPLNNESYLATRDETRRCSQIRRKFSEPAKMSRVGREGSQKAGFDLHEEGNRADTRFFGALSRIGFPTHYFSYYNKAKKKKRERL